MSQTLLIELLTEELPPKALKNLGNAFASAIAEGLKKNQLIDGQADYTAYASPRRLAVQVHGVKAEQNDRVVVKKGPAVTNALKDGIPTKALEGFARSCGVAVSDLKVVHDGKQEVYAHEFTQQGQTLAALLGDILALAVKKLPIPKVMRWGSSSHTFVRPVHGLVVMHGRATVATEVLGLNSQNWTLGHRFLSEGKIVFASADDYATQMREQGKVIASFEERYQTIKNQLHDAAQHWQAQVAADEALLEEVTALVEYPVVLEGTFEEHFLQVPQECLILTMQQNQKYFPLLDKNGKLMNRFLLVSNVLSEDPSVIVRGNERVLRARLSDAAFFYKQDLKQPLESQLSKLNQVVYHNKIGSQAQRVARLMAISTHIAQQLGVDIADTQRAAQLAKADLPTEMVGEFPELQGTMGRYYALANGEKNEVAQAIESHYRPRFAGDDLPEQGIATAVALADKLETLVGIWGIGLIPTGDKDPYALRRAALGALRMLMQTPLSMRDVLETAFNAFENNVLDSDTVAQVQEFMWARLAVWLHNDYPHDIVDAVLAHRPDRLDDVLARLQAVMSFKNLPEAATLSAANKRVGNLLKKADTALGEVESHILQQDEERALFEAVQSLQPKVAAALAAQDFATALAELASIKPQVDAFFDKVMVMTDDAHVKQNRLNVLNVLANLMNAVADISKLDS